MRQKGNLLLILFLLAALFLGPTVILNRMNETPELELRAMVEQEHLLDAPASDPNLPPENASE